MSAPAPKPTTAPDEALSSLMGAALGTPNTARPDSISAPAYGSPADVVLRIRDYIGRHGRENTATLLLYEAMNALHRPAPDAGDTRANRDVAFEAVRKRLCALPRYSFWIGDHGGVKRVEDRSGNWIDFDAAHELFEPAAIDAASAALQGKDGAA